MKDISQKAVLIKLSVSQWTARKFDRAITNEVAANHGVSSDAGRYNKLLIPAEEIKKIAKTVNAARTFFYANTLPWTDEYRIRPTNGYMEFMSELGKHKDAFENETREFCRQYEGLIYEAKQKLNSLFNPADYPNPQDIAKKFGFSVSVMPLAGSKDFRIDLSQAEVQKMGDSLDKANKKAMSGAMSTAWERLHEAVVHMADKLQDGDSVFRNSLVENLEELVKILPVLNIADDPELTKLCEEVDKQLCSLDPDTLREDKKARNDVCRSALNISSAINTAKQESKIEEDKDIFDSIINM